MTKDRKEIRTLPMQEIRVSKSNNTEQVNIEGHAAVFDCWSETLGMLFPFKEKVRNGAFKDSIRKDDIRALFNHDPNYVLGRNKAGTLELDEDDKGLLVRIMPPDTQWARDLVKSIERGDISQMSFGFVVEEDDWRTVDGVDIRELRKVKLYDVSPVTYPAYTQTDVGVRGIERYEEYRNSLKSEQDKEDTAVKEAKDKQRLQLLKAKYEKL